MKKVEPRAAKPKLTAKSKRCIKNPKKPKNQAEKKSKSKSKKIETKDERNQRYKADFKTYKVKVTPPKPPATPKRFVNKTVQKYRNDLKRKRKALQKKQAYEQFKVIKLKARLKKKPLSKRKTFTERAVNFAPRSAKQKKKSANFNKKISRTNAKINKINTKASKISTKRANLKKAYCAKITAKKKAFLVAKRIGKGSFNKLLGFKKANVNLLGTSADMGKTDDTGIEVLKFSKQYFDIGKNTSGTVKNAAFKSVKAVRKIKLLKPKNIIKTAKKFKLETVAKYKSKEIKKLARVVRKSTKLQKKKKPNGKMLEKLNKKRLKLKIKTLNIPSKKDVAGLVTVAVFKKSIKLNAKVGVKAVVLSGDKIIDKLISMRINKAETTDSGVESIKLVGQTTDYVKKTVDTAKNIATAPMRTVKTAKRTIKNAKRTVKTIRNLPRKTVKFAKRTVRTAKRTVRTAKRTVRTLKTAARTAVRTVKLSLRALKFAIQTAIRAIKIAVKLVQAAIKMVAALVKALIAAGPYALIAAAVVIVIVLLINCGGMVLNAASGAAEHYLGWLIGGRSSGSTENVTDSDMKNTFNTAAADLENVGITFYNTAVEKIINAEFDVNKPEENHFISVYTSDVTGLQTVSDTYYKGLYSSYIKTEIENVCNTDEKYMFLSILYVKMQKEANGGDGTAQTEITITATDIEYFLSGSGDDDSVGKYFSFSSAEVGECYCDGCVTDMQTEPPTTSCEGKHMLIEVSLKAKDKSQLYAELLFTEEEIERAENSAIILKEFME